MLLFQRHGRRREKKRPMSTTAAQEWKGNLSPNKRGLLDEVELVLEDIVFDSVALRLHDERMVDRNKTERICKNATQEITETHDPARPREGAYEKARQANQSTGGLKPKNLRIIRCLHIGDQN
jgi:hypothetical protein